MNKKKLVIVESPAKAKTINGYLGVDFSVLASFGHIRELPKKNDSIDIENNFKPNYQLIARNKKHVDEIIAQAKNASEIYIATDPDREGEAIAWHIKEVLIKNKAIKLLSIKRVTFYEITKTAILEAIKNAHEIDENLVQAQQARLTLDYLIGFNVSPLLWRKIRPNLSAGRVQSPALRLICERELEIKSFIPEDYFQIFLATHKIISTKQHNLLAKLVKYNQEKIDVRGIKEKETAIAICNDLQQYHDAVVIKVDKKQKKKNPLPPFITSSLQIEASRKFGFAADKTMKIAQNLYEGITIGKETIGLISYMRTDSVHLSVDAMNEIRDFITNNYDIKYLPAKPVTFISKVKNAQEAHEAIRPTSITRLPKNMKKYLSDEQYNLYELIWLRTLSCQFNPAILDTTAIDLKVHTAIFRLNGMTINFDGFMCVYQEEHDDSINSKTTNNDDYNLNNSNDDSIQTQLPQIMQDEILPIDKIDYSEHQTTPKPRYTEASLVKILEELGIGRPSTYATIIATLKKREYVLMDKKRFVPTDIGAVVGDFLTKHLTNYVDFEFSANLENTLDEISNGTVNKLPVLQQFWQELDAVIKSKQSIERSELTAEKLDEECPECHKQLLIKLGKYGKFIACSGYPDCKYMRKLDNKNDSEETAQTQLEVIADRLCPKDNGQLVIRSGRYGKFISCGNYPECKFIENFDKPDNNFVPIKCPECDDGEIVAKKNRYGSWFYACNNYPTCKTLFNYPPIMQSCQDCAYSCVLHKITKRDGEQIVCPKCKHVNK